MRKLLKLLTPLLMVNFHMRFEDIKDIKKSSNIKKSSSKKDDFLYYIYSSFKIGK
ncbi:hypothetical protein KKA20_02400 [Patescibacteria group bacterium]|nr:hypothetical protein [Patescibacteria group bacterium]